MALRRKNHPGETRALARPVLALLLAFCAVTQAVEFAGGLVSDNEGTVTASYSSGTVATPRSGGGFVGTNTGVISSCGACSTVICGEYAGGFVSYNGFVVRGHESLPGEIRDCYSLGMVDGHIMAGGFICLNNATIRRCYSAGAIHSGGEAGGFLGRNLPQHETTVEQAYWDMEASSIEVSAAGIGKTTEQMRQQASFEGWDFEKVWMICEGKDYPRLRWEGVECDAGD